MSETWTVPLYQPPSQHYRHLSRERTSTAKRLRPCTSRTRDIPKDRTAQRRQQLPRLRGEQESSQNEFDTCPYLGPQCFQPIPLRANYRHRPLVFAPRRTILCTTPPAHTCCRLSPSTVRSSAPRASRSWWCLLWVNGCRYSGTSTIHPRLCCTFLVDSRVWQMFKHYCHRVQCFLVSYIAG